MRRFFLSLACCGVIASCAAPTNPPQRPNVLILCVDALRPDRLGAYGGRNAVSPNLDNLARESVIFEQAISVASWTKPAVASLLTGLYPSQHRVVRAGAKAVDVLPDEVTTLAERLAAAGYHTAAFVDNDHLLARSSNFDQGFQTYLEDSEGAPRLAHQFLSWIEDAKQEPFFSYIHILDPHWPYTPDLRAQRSKLTPTDRLRFLHWGLGAAQWWLLREQVNRGLLKLAPDELETLKTLYDSEIFATDAVLGRLFRLLQDYGLLDRTLVVVTSDHGEGFLEHGRLDHGYGLYDELLRIPLIVRLPGAAHAGLRIAQQVQSVDIVPTVLELAGIRGDGRTAGRSLLPLLSRRAPPEAEAMLAEESYGRTRIVALRSRLQKYIRTEGSTFTDLSQTPEIPVDAVAGIRVQVEGIFAGGGLIGSQVKQVGAGDRDHEIAGPITAIDQTKQTMQLVGYEIELGDATRLSDRQGTFALSDLQPLQWVRAEARVRDGRMRATKVARIFEAWAKEVELEGIVEAIGATGNGEVWLQLSGRKVRIDGDAVWKNFAAARRSLSPVAQAAAPVEPTVVEELYDLQSDPTEQRNLATRAPDSLLKLREYLDGERVRLASMAAATAEPAVLDDQTRERLRLLGYLPEDSH